MSRLIILVALVFGCLSAIAQDQSVAGFNDRFTLVKNDQGKVTVIKLKRATKHFTLKPFIQQLKNDLLGEQQSLAKMTDTELDDMMIELGINPYAFDYEGGSAEAQHFRDSVRNVINIDVEAAFAELEQAKGMDGDMDSDFGDHEEPEIGGDDMGGDDDMMGKPAFEGRRMTREYVEKVGNDWEKSGSQKGQGQTVGAGSGETMSAPVTGKSPVSSGKGKPTTGATAGNLVQGADEGGSPTGTSPAGKAGGFLSKEKDMNTGNGNVPGGKMGVKNLSKVGSGYPGNNKSAGPVGSGTGDKAGQTGGADSAKSPINGAPNRNA
jgi:hypothetical protein